jgi:hypothetical protein
LANGYAAEHPAFRRILPEAVTPALLSGVRGIVFDDLR